MLIKTRDNDGVIQRRYINHKNYEKYKNRIIKDEEKHNWLKQ